MSIDRAAFAAGSRARASIRLFVVAVLGLLVTSSAGKAQGVPTLWVGDESGAPGVPGIGAPGGTVAMTIGITGATGQNVGSVQVDVLFDNTTPGISFANVDQTTQQVSDCVAADQYTDFSSSASIFDAHLAPPPGESRLRLGIFNLKFGSTQTIEDGTLFTCTFQISPNVTPPASFGLAPDPGLVSTQVAEIGGLVVLCGTGSSAQTPCGTTPDSITVAEATPTATNTPLPTATKTPLPTATNTLPPTATPTVPPTATAAAAPAVSSGGGCSCSIAAPGSSGAVPWWLMLPAVVVLWRRRFWR